MATYNGAPYLQQQLQSILDQLGPDDEVIISDDGSTDDTLQLIHEASQHSATPIRLLSNPGPHGYTSNFEHALRHAQGDYIMLADQDDVWLPGKAGRMLQPLITGQADLTVSNARVTDGDLRVTHDDYFAARGVHRGFWGNIYKFGYLGCCMALTHRLLQVALPFPTRRDYCTHDNWLFLCAASRHRELIIDEPLLLYRRHGSTQTTGAINAHKGWSFRFCYRLYLLFHICRRRWRSL